jgi:tripartite ATP-independent transporter DctM subunit
MSIFVLTFIFFALLIILLVLGLPVAYTLGGLSLAFVLYEFGIKGLFMLASSAFDSWTNSILVSVPLFVLMAQFLTRSGVADDIYEFMYKWMGPLRGGLAMGTVGICTMFAAMAGVSAVGTVTMGLAALPAMLKRGYDKNIAVGCISAGGTLGILIPPSVPMIMYGYLAKESIGSLFLAGIGPGLLLSLLFILYIGTRCFLNPKLGPPVERKGHFGLMERIMSLKAVVLPLILIIVVLGFIYGGVTTPTETAGVGAIGAFICVLIYRRFSLKMLNESLMDTLRITAICGWIILGSQLFTNVYTGMGASELVQNFIIGSDLNRWAILVLTQMILLVLGMFMDPIGIMMICIPIFVPIIKAVGFNTVWFGILFVINLEMGYITPPFGVNLFYMKSIVPPNINMATIYQSVLPFILLQMIGMAMVMFMPDIALWLPSRQ